MLLFLNKDYCCCSLTSYLSNRCGGISIIYRILRLACASGCLSDPVFCCCSLVLEICRLIFAAILRTCCLVLLTVSCIIAFFEIYPRKKSYQNRRSRLQSTLGDERFLIIRHHAAAPAQFPLYCSLGDTLSSVGSASILYSHTYRLTYRILIKFVSYG